jgi:hypothetical protein
LVEALTP